MSNARFSILQARAIGDIRISDAQFRTLAALGMYAARTVKKFLSRTTILMHRQIKNAGSLEVDHINGNGLDNKKSNLRLCTRQQNSRNVSKKNKTGYKGVHKSGNKFIAQIWINKKCIHLGTFETDTQAAIAYNEKASELFGEFANLN